MNLTKETDIILLPNGYGRLKYIDTLEKVLIKNGYLVTVPILSGQAHRKLDSVLDLNSGTIDLQHEISRVSINKKIPVIAHCSSLILLSRLDEKSLNSISSIILYSYLANPHLHYNRFQEKCRKFGVNINVSENDLRPYSDFRSYSNTSIPIILIHPFTPLNNLRASKSDLDQFSTLPSVKAIYTPEIGYEIEDDYQEKKVDYIFQSFIKDQINSWKINI